MIDNYVDFINSDIVILIIYALSIGVFIMLSWGLFLSFHHTRSRVFFYLTLMSLSHLFMIAGMSFYRHLSTDEVRALYRTGLSCTSIFAFLLLLSLRESLGVTRETLRTLWERVTKNEIRPTDAKQSRQ